MPPTTFLIVITLAAAVTGLLAWRVKPPAFRSFSWRTLGLAAALFWGLLAVLLYQVYWVDYYSFFALPYGRFLAPLAGVIYFLVCLLMRWLALRLPGNPTINFLLFGGLESIPEHALGIVRFKILEIPMLAGFSAGEIYLFAFFEYIIYWGIVLTLGAGLRHFMRSTS